MLVITTIVPIRNASRIRGLLRYLICPLLADTSIISSARQNSAFDGGIYLPGPIIVRIKRASGADDLPLPMRMTEHAAGFDLPAAVRGSVVLTPREIRLIACGL